MSKKPAVLPYVIAAFASMVCLVVACVAEAEAEEYAQTPADLGELLGANGLEGLAIESRLSLRRPDDDTAGDIEYQGCFGDDGLLVIHMRKREGTHGRGEQRHVFDADGILIESRREGGSIDYRSTESTVREGDDLRLSRTFTPDDGEPQTDEEVQPYRPVAGTIPSVWLPIALSYHLREGHDRFVVRFCDDYTGRQPLVQTYHVIDAGLEMIEVCGVACEAHALTIRQGMEIDGEPMDLGPIGDDTMLWHVLADGTVVRIHIETRRLMITAEAVTAEEADALLEGGREDTAE